MTHPHDFAQLCDLLDGTLAPALAEELRRRLPDEPELRATWDDLQRNRRALRTLASPPVPAGFLAGVRSRAGLPEVPADDAAAARPLASAAETPSSSPREAPAGRILRIRPWIFAAAASVGIAVGFAGWLVGRRSDAVEAPRSDEAAKGASTASSETLGDLRKAQGNETPRIEDALHGPDASPRGDPGTLEGRSDRRKLAGEPEGRGEAPSPSSSATGAGGGAGASPERPPAQGPFLAPGGAVNPGLRAPSDDAGPPTGRLAARGGSAPPASPSPTAATDARVGKRAAEPTVAAKAGENSVASRFAWAKDGVDDVLLLSADGLDEARAAISVLRLSVAARPAATAAKAPENGRPAPLAGDKSAQPAKPENPELKERESDADGESDSADDPLPRLAGLERLAKEGSAEPATKDELKDRAADAMAPQVLGSFVLELTAAEWDALTAPQDAKGGTREWKGEAGEPQEKRLREQKPGAAAGPSTPSEGRPDSPATSPPSTLPSASPAMSPSEPERAGGPVARRVRIVVLRK